MPQEVLLYTQDLPAATKEIASLGGRITQQLTNVVIVVNFPESVNSESLTYAATVAPSNLDQISQIAANAWENLGSKRESQAPSPAEGLPWDAPGFQSPRKVQGEPQSLRPDVAESTGTPTSLYMVGSITVGVIIVSGLRSDQPALRFSDAERQTVIQEVQEGLSFLANAETRANISFVYDIRFIDVTVTPGSTSNYESAEAPWRDAALGQMGFSASRQGSIDYVQKLRHDKGTDWAYVAYFTKYPLHHFAYAVDEKLCMEYSNDGWGTDLINRVFAHESCHIFGAADEYGSCDCDGSHGYLGVPNNNCVNCTGTHVSCLMERNELTMCQWTRGQIGWDDRLFKLIHQATNSQVLFYNLTGLSVANTFDQAGNTKTLQKYPFSGGWTHITLIAPGIVLFYNAITGAGTANTFDQAGNTKTLKTYSFAGGWTRITAISPGIVLFYNAATGAGTVNTFDQAGNTKTLKTYSFASGWTSITVIEPGIVLFYNAATGAGTANTFDEAGNTKTLKTYPFAGGWKQITVISPGIVLFYNAATGAGTANTFDQAGNTKTLQTYSFASGWTRITAISPGIVLFYNAATGLGVANTFDSAANTNFLQKYAFSGGWTQIKKLK
jgi:hypothetical protein